MEEKDYIELAHKMKEDKVVDEFWLEVARTSIWISKDGTKTRFSDLELGHLKNIINGLTDFENKNCKFVLRKLINELIVRIKRKPPRYAYDAVEQLTVLAVDNGADAEKCYGLRETILTEFDKLKEDKNTY